MKYLETLLLWCLGRELASHGANFEGFYATNYIFDFYGECGGADRQVLGFYEKWYRNSSVFRCLLGR